MQGDKKIVYEAKSAHKKQKLVPLQVTKLHSLPVRKLNDNVQSMQMEVNVSRSKLIGTNQDGGT